AFALMFLAIEAAHATSSGKDAQPAAPAALPLGCSPQVLEKFLAGFNAHNRTAEEAGPFAGFPKISLGNCNSADLRKFLGEKREKAEGSEKERVDNAIHYVEQQLASYEKHGGELPSTATN